MSLNHFTWCFHTPGLSASAFYLGTGSFLGVLLGSSEILPTSCSKDMLETLVA